MVMVAIRALGIDPGLRHTGWGVVDIVGARLTHVAHGTIAPDPDEALSLRLGRLFEAVTQLIATHQPTAAMIEETYVNANPRSALALGAARGACLAALGCAGLAALEITPTEVKKAIVGTGRAEKAQIAFMVQRLLPGLGETGADAADALAIAIAGAPLLQLQKRAFG